LANSACQASDVREALDLAPAVAELFRRHAHAIKQGEKEIRHMSVVGYFELSRRLFGSGGLQQPY